MTLETYQEDPAARAVATSIRTVADEATALEIVDDTTNGHALELLARCRIAVKQVEALRKKFVDPLNAQVRVINDHFKSMAGPAASADAILTVKTGAYRRKLAEAAAAEQERLRKLAEARAARQTEKAEVLGIQPPAAMPFMPTVEAPPKTAFTPSGQNSITFRKVRHFEIVDETKVPRQFWVIDQVKLGGVIRAGVEEIPGVRIWESEEPTVR